ncbi:HEAT repeat domain-containing protein [Lentzea sp. BCCO 10_0061]|uniref:HEAT repeat domain-containing protein n=1 Tax=Lentzea sokolovensis TaxID=3095429 RepID=A0ABU4V935_9PSEU|nr:HEAT repeat domain-containing protein [Lentzea sp. BCCO 10_0061]MDX8148317.1 HEAT repeat domain-containing protein [Lentzea sp. BCCO 10_0061]
MTKRFDEALWLMRRHDPQKAEDGFGLLRQIAAEHVDELVEAFRAEDDRGVRAWLLELIGDARSPEALPILVEHLDHEDESLADWAVAGLRKLDTKEARIALYRHRANNAHN